MTPIRAFGYATAATLTLLAWYSIGRWSGMIDDRDQLEQQATESFLVTSTAFKQHIARLTAVELQHTRAARWARHEADSVRTWAAGLTMPTQPSLPALDSAAAIAATWRGVADAEHRAASECFVALDACDQKAAALTARLDSAEVRLQAELKRHQCRILFVRCPSRSVMFTLGAGLGAIGGVWLARQ